jgi:hypothetical protein
MTIGIVYASTPDELLCTNKYRYKYIMVPIDFNDNDKPVLRHFNDIGLTEISQLVGTTDVILQIDENDPVLIETLCLEAFAYKIASRYKEVLEQIHLECSSISLGLIEDEGYAYIDSDDSYIEFLVLNLTLTNQKRVFECKSENPQLSLFIGEICSKKDAEMAMFWKLDGAITRKPELLQYMEESRW